jgi:hypothetical protein
MGRGETAQHGALPTRQDGGEIARLGAGGPVTDSIHTPPLAMKRSLPSAALDGAAAQSGFEQLRDGDDTMLASGYSGHFLVR